MPEGLQYVLSSKVSDFPRISVVGYETGPSLFVDRFIQEAVTNCLEVAEGNRAHLHLVLLSHDVNSLRLPYQRTDISTYEFARGPSICEDLESLYEVIVKNVEAKPGGTHIMLIDDYAMFSSVYSARDTRRQAHFLRLMCKRFRKMFIFFQKESLSKEEIGMIYDISTDIAFLQLHPADSYGPVCTNNSRFVCDVLKIGTDRRVTHDKTLLQISEDEIKEELIVDSSDKGGNGGSEVLKNLTTFKLTLEDDERESKNMLHLPYFEAQKTSLEDPENYDDFDEDEEEDEEA